MKAFWAKYRIYKKRFPSLTKAQISHLVRNYPEKDFTSKREVGAVFAGLEKEVADIVEKVQESEQTVDICIRGACVRISGTKRAILGMIERLL